MSAPVKRRRTTKKKEPEPKRVAREKAPKPKTAAPSAMVESRHGDGMVHREARGYSMGEVSQAGLTVGVARRWGVPVDDRRRSVLEGNVASLKKWAPRPPKTVEGRMEGEVKKVEKEVEKEVREVEKEMKKVEEEVVEKVEAPVKRRARKKEAAEEKSA